MSTKEFEVFLCKRIRIAANLSPRNYAHFTRFLAVAIALIFSANNFAQAQDGPILPDQLTARPGYVELIHLAQASDIVVQVFVDEQITVPLERAPGLQFGNERLYIESTAQTLLSGRSAISQSMVFLVDLPLDAEGDAPDLEEQSFLLFGRSNPSRPGELQLVGPNAMLLATADAQARVRMVLSQLAAADRPPVITDIAEVISVPGNLAGESETQIFLETEDGAPVSLNVLRRPGMKPSWGVSWTEIVDQSTLPPQLETMDWYALACFLPPEIPQSAFLQRDRESRARANADYQHILAQLGDC